MDLDKFGEFKHWDEASKIKLWNFDGFGIASKEFLMKICKKINFGRSLFFDSFDFWGVFSKLWKIRAFSGEGYFWENCSWLPDL